MSILRGFPPIAAEDARLLILGSMPGAASLAAGEYYAHPRNAFWPILCTLLAAPNGLDYAGRCQLLERNGIAVWDVLQACRRRGSLDSAIEPETMISNPIADFLQCHRQVRRIFFNGGSAERLFIRHIMLPPDLAGCHGLLRLPSTSPANARLRFADKLAAWRVILNDEET